ncbi:hypothetical protein HOE07_00020 [archaeon]|jgi:predicted nucleotidyltransferase|nr:hypothetical protein [archaeon]
MKRNNIKMKLKEYFFRHPTKKLRVRQIEREVNIPLPSAIRYTKELEKEGILIREEIAEVVMFSADRASRIFLLEKRFFNMGCLFNSGLIDFIIKKMGAPNIILFGSYSNGEDVESSDIDIFIESSFKGKLDLTKFEKKLSKEIQIICSKNLSSIKNKNLANNIVNGVVLNGFFEVF